MTEHTVHESRLTRRHILMGLGMAVAGLALSACGGAAETSAPVATAVTSVSTAVANTAPTVASVATTVAKAAPQAASASGQAVTIDFWLLGGADQARIINDNIIAEYKKSNPNANVTLQMLANWQDLYQKYLTSMAGGAPPNMGRMKDYWTPQFGTRSGLVDLDKYVKSADFDPKRYAPQRWDSTQVGGKTYSIPWTLFQHYQFYNETLLKTNGYTNADGTAKAPDTWDERREYAKKMTNPTNQQWGNMLYSTNNTEGTTFDWMDRVLEAGGKLMNEERTKFLFNTAEGVAPIDYYLDMLYKDKSTIPPGVTVENGVNGGKVALWINGPWTVPAMKTQAPDLKWSVALHPQNKNRAAQLMGNNLGMFAGAKNVEATWSYVTFMAKPENDLIWNSQAGYLPVQIANWDKPPYSDNPVWKTMTTQAKRDDSPTLPIVLDYQEILEGIANELQLAYLQKKEPKVAVASAFDKATEILNRSIKK